MEELFGNLFRNLRMEKGYTLREYCRKFQKDPSYISKIERGKLAPPINKDDLAVLARSLDIEENSKQWKEFIFTAQICAKRIPEGEMTDEQFEFVMAVDTYKRNNKRPFPTLTEILEIIKAIGYKKID